MSLNLSGVTISGRSLLTILSPGPTDPYFSNVTLLLHADGVNGATTTTDSSNSARTITMNGDALPTTGAAGPSTASLSTSVFKFGTSSFRLNTVTLTDYVSMTGSPISTTGQFTLEAWVYPTVSTSAAMNIYNQYTSGSDGNRFTFSLTGTNRRVVCQFGATSYGNGTGESLNLNTWYHVALTRDASNILRIFVNGNLDYTSPGAVGNTIGQTIGRFGMINSATNTGSPFRGYIDEMRITDDVCRYTASFTAPTAAFPNS